jgi:hypothetical protein
MTLRNAGNLLRHRKEKTVTQKQHTHARQPKRRRGRYIYLLL